MSLTEIPHQLKEQFESVAEIVQANVVGTIEWLTEHGTAMLPHPAAQLRSKLPQAVDFSFDTVDGWLRSQRDLATRFAKAVAPAA